MCCTHILLRIPHWVIFGVIFPITLARNGHFFMNHSFNAWV